MTRRPAAIARLEKAGELLRREPESNRVPDEQQAGDGVVRVVTEPARGARRPRQDADAFVVAHQIRADAGATRRLTDAERCSWHGPSYNLESFQVQVPVGT